MDIEIGGAAITVVTPASPLGRALVGRRIGETAALAGGRGPLGIVGATA
jgi:transcription elongation GreA/GreB family factor